MVQLKRNITRPQIQFGIKIVMDIAHMRQSLITGGIQN